MSRRARKVVDEEAVPEWPNSLKLVPVVAVQEPQPQKVAPPLFVVGLGLLKDGRHVAFEAEVQGRTVLAWRPLCARPTADGPERAWWQVAYAKVYQRRELTEQEAAANVRDTAGVRPEDFDHGQAVAIHTAGKKSVALAMDFAGLQVTDPVVLTTAPRDYCWIRIDSWAGLNMLPRRRR